MAVLLGGSIVFAGGMSALEKLSKLRSDLSNHLDGQSTMQKVRILAANIFLVAGKLLLATASIAAGLTICASPLAWSAETIAIEAIVSAFPYASLGICSLLANIITK